MSVVNEVAKRVSDGLFRSLTLRRFFDEYYLRLPVAISAMSDELRALGDWAVIESIVARPDIDLLVVRAGVRHPYISGWSIETLRAAVSEGYTVVVRHAERSDPRLEKLALEFGELFSGASTSTSIALRPRSSASVGTTMPKKSSSCRRPATRLILSGRTPSILGRSKRHCRPI